MAGRGDNRQGAVAAQRGDLDALVPDDGVAQPGIREKHHVQCMKENLSVLFRARNRVKGQSSLCDGELSFMVALDLRRRASPADD